MRILFHLLDAGIGGGQRVALAAAQRLRDSGHTLGLAVPTSGPAADEFADLGAHITLLDASSLRRPRGAARLAEVLRGYDILYSHTSAPGQILGQLAARRARRPHVVHQHTYPYFSTRPAGRAAQIAVYRLLMSRSRFIAVAPHVADGLVEVGVARERITVVPNGVRVPATPPPTKANGGPVRVGMLARLDPGKGIQTFVTAAGLAGLDLQAASYLIGGAPGPFTDFEAEIRAEAARAGIDIVEPGAQGEALLAKFDIVVIPSRYEGSPLVLLESMACGRAIIATDIPGMREVLGPSGAGLLVPVDDPAALATAMRSLALDSELRLQFGRRAWDLAGERYRIEGVLDRIERVIAEALAEA